MNKPIRGASSDRLQLMAMKIAVLADIHANYAALQAVTEDIDRWEPDLVIAAGDIINRGPRPLECLRLILERQRTDGWLTILGNHEEYVIAQASPQAPRSGPAADVHQASRWTCMQIGYDVSPLVTMPFKLDIPDPGGNLVRFVHASILGTRIGIHPETTDEELSVVTGIPADDASPAKSSSIPLLFCVGHTHKPLIRTLNHTQVINAGSAGLPFDGDTRPAYARLNWNRGAWQASIVRVDYDLKQAWNDFYDCGYLEGGGPLVRLVEIELLQARSLLYSWTTSYQEQVLNGVISMEQSVRAMMDDYGLNKA